MDGWGLLHQARQTVSPLTNPHLHSRFTFADAGGPALPHMERVRRYIAAQYPFWNASGGRDHAWWLTGDLGMCDDGEEQQFAHTIK